MSCYSTLRILRPHIARLGHHVARLGHHVSHHFAHHKAMYVVGVMSVGCGAGLREGIKYLPPTTARPVEVRLPAPVPTDVPEPGTLVLLASGLVGLVVAKGRAR